MQPSDLVILAVTLLILAEVTYLLAKLPKSTIKAKDRAVLIDTSVLMDGRIIPVASTGFIGGTLVIPRSVIGELQLLADGSDSEKRARARYGLDAVSFLQKLDVVTVEILQDGSKATEGVDERLLSLAKQHHAAICTLDYNLNKVAIVEGIQVLNINELAQSVRMSYLPGDQLTLDLVQKGQDSHQAVGYLPDGTMVVVEQSIAYVGKPVRIEVIRSLQTAAGKMMFAKRIDDNKDGNIAHVPRKPFAQKTAATAAAVRKASGRKIVAQVPPREVKPAATQQDRHGVQPKPQVIVSSPPEAKTPTQRKPQQRSRRRDHEADLINLVNNQDQS